MSPLPATSPRGLLLPGSLLLVATVLVMLLFMSWVVSLGDRMERERVLSLARTVAALLDAPRIARLQGTPGDTGTTDLETVRAQLRQARNANPDFRFVYLMRPATADPTRMAFLADAEAADSPDYSAPGDVYDGPSEELWQAWRNADALVQPAYEDDWGQWVTAAAPLRTPDGSVTALVGMDLRADAWHATLARYRAFALAIGALVMLLEVLFLLGLHLQRRNASQLATANATLADQLDALERAQAGLQLADAVVRHTGEAILVLDPHWRILRANPGFHAITGFSETATPGMALPLEPEAETQLRGRMQSLSHWDGTLWAHRADGGRFPIEASVDAVLDNQGRIRQYVVLFRDVTVQKRLEDRLRELSTTDGLTLLANRRRFDDALELAWRGAMRTGAPVSLLMIDIDYFKPYNDFYGHPAGDRCLQQVAAALSATVTAPDATVARYGGEEFAVILPGCDASGAEALAERLRERVQSLGLPHQGNPTGHVTISVGASTRTPPQTADVEALMEGADQALYRAKQGGRNNVVSED